MLSTRNPVISHDKIIGVMTQLGYERVKKGVCNGLAQMWVQAVLCEERDKFMARLYFICADSNLFEKIAAAKAKKNKNLTLEDQRCIDVLAFFDGVQLYQNFGLYTHLFKETPHHLDAATISKLTLPSKLDRRPLIEIHSENRWFNITTMQEYLNNLANEFKLYYEARTELATHESLIPELVISLHSCTHKIALQYREHTSSWELTDANQYTPFDLFNNTAAFDVLTALTEGYKTPVNVSIFTTKNNMLKPIMQQQLKKIKTQYSISIDDACAISNLNSHFLTLTAMRGEENSFLEVISKIPNRQLHEYMIPAINTALYHGQTHIIRLVLEKYPDCILAIPDKQWLLTTAIKTRQNGLISAIYQFQIDVNEKSKKGQTPLHIAISVDNLEAAKELVKLNTDVNLTNTEGETSLTYAIKLHRIEIISFLVTMASLKADLQNAAGDPALIVAVKEGSIAACEVLLAKGFNPNVSNRLGETPALIAVDQQHFHCLKLLIAKKADVSVVTNDCRSPIFLATIRTQWEMAGYILLHLKNLECFNSYSYLLVTKALKKIVQQVIEHITLLPNPEKRETWLDIKNKNNALGMMLSKHPKNECCSFFKEKETRRKAYLNKLHAATKVQNTEASNRYARI